MDFIMTPVGHVSGGRADPIDDDWGQSRAVIELDAARFDDTAMAGLDAFSHAEIIFVFDRVDEDEIVSGARHPRGRSDWPKIGIFAQRGKNRPNRIADRLPGGFCVRPPTSRGPDAIDGTPVLDIKPFMAGLPHGATSANSAWAGEIMSGYW